MPLATLSFLFWCLPAVILAFFAVSFSKKAQNGVLLVASLLLYTLGQTVYVAVLVAVIAANWLFGLWMRGKDGGRKGVFLLSCLCNAAVLLVFKFAAPLQAFTGGWQIVLPIGLSLYVLQAIAYCADVYSGETEPEKNIASLGLYLSFFPKIIAGPILRYADFKTALDTRCATLDNAHSGFVRVIVGLGKIVIVAQPFASLAHHIFIWSAMGQAQMAVSVLTAWIGVISLWLQLYFELSGCADMAIGLAQIFGITLPENFNRPFAASTVTGFWNRFNITVIDWFRTYVSRPLNKKATNRDTLVRNNLIVWLLMGLWYKAGWEFLVFGFLFFACTLVEEFFGVKEREQLFIGRFLYTQGMVMAGWVILKTENLYQMGRYFMNLLGASMNALADARAFALLKENGIWFAVAAALLIAPLQRWIDKFKNHERTAVRTGYICVQAIVVCLVLFFSAARLLQSMATYYFYL